MAGGSFGPTGVAKERAEQYRGRVTAHVIIACIVAAVGGSIFGYDIGISGTVRFPPFYLVLHAANNRLLLVSFPQNSSVSFVSSFRELLSCEQ